MGKVTINKILNVIIILLVVVAIFQVAIFLIGKTKSEVEDALEGLSDSFSIAAERVELEDFIEQEDGENADNLPLQDLGDGEPRIFGITDVFTVSKAHEPSYYSGMLDQVKVDFADYETPIDILLSINKNINSKYKLDQINGLEPIDIVKNNKKQAKKIQEKAGFNINEKIIEQIIINDLARIKYIVQEQDTVEEKSFESEMLIKILNHNFSEEPDKDSLLDMSEYMYTINKEEWLPTVRFWLYNNIISLEDIEIIQYEDILKSIIDEMIFLRNPEVKIILLESDSDIKSMDGKEVLFEALITIDGILYNAYLGLDINNVNLSLFDVR